MIDLIRLSRGQDIGISNLSENRGIAAAPSFHRLNDLIGINLAVGVDRAPKDRSYRQIEFELEKAERGMAMPYDAENVARLRGMLREARKQKLSAGLRERRERDRS